MEGRTKIGFEDMINVAEETRDPERTVPLGLILAMAGAAVLYIAVAVTAVSVVPWQDLAAAPGPITEVMGRAAPSIPPFVFTVITLFAVANTALVNYVTASRLIYGMARQGLLPRTLGSVHSARRTPHIAVAALFLVLAPLALLSLVVDASNSEQWRGISPQMLQKLRTVSSVRDDPLNNDIFAPYRAVKRIAIEQEERY